MSCGRVIAARLKSGAVQVAGDLPTRIASASCATLSCWCSGGSRVRSRSSWLCAVVTSICPATPAPCAV